MSDNERDLHRNSVNRFIALANEMKDDGIDINLVSASLMTASCVYASYVAGGNDGGLTESGVDKVADVYRKELARIQELKKTAAGVAD
jgi:hypothetical protein